MDVGVWDDMCATCDVWWQGISSQGRKRGSVRYCAVNILIEENLLPLLAILTSERAWHVAETSYTFSILLSQERDDPRRYRQAIRCQRRKVGIIQYSL